MSSADGLILLALAVAAVLGSYCNAALIDPIVIDKRMGDVFFTADVPRVFANLTDRRSNYFRMEVHPLFALVAYPPALFLRRVTGLEALPAIRLLIAGVAGLWVAGVFILLRQLGCRRLDAVLFVVLGAVSAAAVFWFAVSETYSFGSLSIVLALLFVIAAERRRLSAIWFVGLNLMTMSITISNGMVGLLITCLFHPWRRAWRIMSAAFGILLILSVLQKGMFTNFGLPLTTLAKELRFTRSEPVAGSGVVATSFFLHTMVMPATELVENTHVPEWPKLLTRAGPLAWASSWGAVAAAMWLVLLGLGFWALIQLEGHRQLRLVLAGTLVGQLTLHLFYGRETFLYSLHWTPLLIVVAALSTLTRARPAALVLAVLVILTATVNNTAQLRQAASYLATPLIQLDSGRMRPAPDRGAARVLPRMSVRDLPFDVDRR